MTRLKNFRTFSPKKTNAILLTSFSLAIVGLFNSCAGTPAKPQSSAENAAKTSDSSGNVVPLVGSFQVHRFVLDNGLRLLVVEDHRSPTVAYQTWFRVGSRDEVPGRTGLAHLFEHMMFKGTKTVKDGEYFKTLEAAGAEGVNAFTSEDFTAYVQEVPREKVDLVARLESDRMVNLVVDENSFKTEREVVQNERRMRTENNPDGTLMQDLHDIAFTRHSYHWPVIGYSKDLEAMTAQDAVDFYKSYYSPNHATIVMVGDITPELALETIKNHYGSLPGQPSPAHEITAEPEQKAPRRKTDKLSIQVEKLLMGYHIPAFLNEDMPALELLQAILVGGKSSRLHRALVETGVANSVGGGVDEHKDPEFFLIDAALQKGKHAAQAESIVLKELSRLTQELVSDQELERAKNRTEFGFYEQFDGNMEKANFLGEFEAIAGDFQAGVSIYKKIPLVTALDIQAVIKRYFDPKNRDVVTGVRK